MLLCAPVLLSLLQGLHLLLCVPELLSLAPSLAPVVKHLVRLGALSVAAMTPAYMVRWGAACMHWATWSGGMLHGQVGRCMHALGNMVRCGAA